MDSTKSGHAIDDGSCGRANCIHEQIQVILCSYVLRYGIRKTSHKSEVVHAHIGLGYFLVELAYEISDVRRTLLRQASGNVRQHLECMRRRGSTSHPAR